jgi:hypothetical protein
MMSLREFNNRRHLGMGNAAADYRRMSRRDQEHVSAELDMMDALAREMVGHANPLLELTEEFREGCDGELRPVFRRTNVP